MILKKKKKAKTYKMSDIATRIRGFILDSQVSDAHEISVILGCSIISDEVQEMEEKESDKRVSKVAYLIPLVYSHCHLLAEGASEHQRMSVKDKNKIPEAVWIESKNLIESVSMSALLGSISQLVDMGLLDVPKEYRK